MLHPFRSTLAVALLLAAMDQSAAGATTTTTVDSLTRPEPKAVVAAVIASASPVALRLGAKLGRPSCPPVEKARIGLTLQCTVAFDKSPVAWLVSLAAGGALIAAPTFPVVSRRQAELVAGPRSTCTMASFAGVPVGATVVCAVANTTIELAVLPDGTLRRPKLH